MKYIYDVLLNFNNRYYDFYDWNNSDNIIHIRKVPIFKISRLDLYNIKNNIIKFDELFLKKIENKTEMFTNRGFKILKYVFLLSDGENIIGINYNNKNYKISSLLVDEELDILEDVEEMDLNNIKYKIIKNNEVNNFKTRKQLEIEKYLKNELFKIKDNEELLEYLYYECYDKKEKDINKIIVNLNELENNTIDKLYSFFKITKVNK